MALFGQIWVIFYLRSQLYIASGFQLNLFILPNYVLIFPNFVFQVIYPQQELNFMFKSIDSFLALFWLFRGPQNYTFWLFKSVFWPFFIFKFVNISF